MRVLVQSNAKNIQQTSLRGIEIEIDPQKIPEASKVSSDAGICIYTVGQHKALLENYFLAVTGGGVIGNTVSA